MMKYLLNSQQVAEMLGVHRNTILLWVKKRIIPHRKLSTRCTRFCEAEIKQWVEDCTVKAIELGKQQSAQVACNCGYDGKRVVYHHSTCPMFTGVL